SNGLGLPGVGAPLRRTSARESTMSALTSWSSWPQVGTLLAQRVRARQRWTRRRRCRGRHGWSDGRRGNRLEVALFDELVRLQRVVDSSLMRVDDRPDLLVGRRLFTR